MGSVKGDGDWLADIRRQIDTLDNEILERCNERARLALEVADAKRAAGETDYYRPDREAALLRRLCEKTRAPLESKHVLRIHREIVSVCRSLETSLRVAFCDTFAGAERAAVEHFGHSVQTIARDGVASVVEQVQSDHADFGVLPEAGLIEQALYHHRHESAPWRLRICAEIVPGQDDESQTHPKKQARESAGILTRALVRTLVIGKLKVPPTGEDKTSLLLTSRDPTSDLASLERWLVDSRELESATQQHLSFIELNRHIQDADVAAALEVASTRGAIITVLGSYPRAVV